MTGTPYLPVTSSTSNITQKKYTNNETRARTNVTFRSTVLCEWNYEYYRSQEWNIILLGASFSFSHGLKLNALYTLATILVVQVSVYATALGSAVVYFCKRARWTALRLNKKNCPNESMCCVLWLLLQDVVDYIESMVRGPFCLWLGSVYDSERWRGPFFVGRISSLLRTFLNACFIWPKRFNVTH